MKNIVSNKALITMINTIYRFCLFLLLQQTLIAVKHLFFLSIKKSLSHAQENANIAKKIADNNAVLNISFNLFSFTLLK